MSSFFDTVRKLNEGYNDMANEARRIGAEAHSETQMALHGGGSAHHARNLHLDAARIHNELAKSSEHSHPAAAEYHKELARHHDKIADLHSLELER